MLDDQYLPIDAIAVGTGVSVSWARRLSKQDAWPSRPERTGAARRPQLLYRVGDARASIAAAAARRRRPRPARSVADVLAAVAA